MDNLDRIDDSLKKKEWPRATILIILIGIVAVWLLLGETLTGKEQAEKEHAKEIKDLHASYATKIDSLNVNWAKMYNAQVDGRLKDQDENIRILREKDEEYSEAAFRYYSESRSNRIKTERNNKKVKELETVAKPVR